jgi:peptidoglycan/LPS O-acetylase OafA/YrhL
MKRLTQIDALRGLAATSVMAFHYTYKYDDFYHFVEKPPFQAPWGYLGVNLFFVISGFVIFMTLDRTRAPMDFVVSRASRLFPAYWTAIILTTLVTHWLGLPGKEVSWTVAFLNFPMIQQLFSIPLVDSVYWTLLVELLFYTLAFALFVTRSLHRVLFGLGALLALRLLYWACAEFLHVDLPWRISQLLILDAIPFFALGIVAFRLTRESSKPAKADLLTAISAVVILGITDSPLMGCVGIACFLLVLLAAMGRLPFLQLGLFVWLGTISYPLYLLHENIGWAVFRQLQMHGWATTNALLLTTASTLALATAVCFGIERPAMAAIRRRYKLYRANPPSPATH